MQRIRLAGAVSVATLFLGAAAPALAHDPYGEHGQVHDELNQDHAAQHDQLGAEHEAYHEQEAARQAERNAVGANRGLSGWLERRRAERRHRVEHMREDQEHDAGHAAAADEHEAYHEQAEAPYGGYAAPQGPAVTVPPPAPGYAQPRYFPPPR